MSSRTYYSCDICTEPFDEYDPGGSCEQCCKNLCPACYGEFVGVSEGQVSVISEKECPFCNKSFVGDADLLKHALEKLNMTREELRTDWANG